MDFKQNSAFSCVIGDLVLYADKRCYEIRHMPRGRICRIVETAPSKIPGVHFTAVASPVTNMQRAMMTTKQIGWMKDDVTLAQCCEQRTGVIEC